MLNKKRTFKEFMQGNGFYVLTGVVLIGVVVTAMVLPKKGEGDVAQQAEKYAQNQPAAAEDISKLRVPTVEPRIGVEDELSIAESSKEDASVDAQAQAPIIQIEDKEENKEDPKEDNKEEELVAETFSSTTTDVEEVFHVDDDFFSWPVDEQVIYDYSDNDTGRSFMNPTLDRTMRSFGLFLKTEEEAKVKVAAQGKILSVSQYPTAGIDPRMDYPQVGLAVVVDHGNDWKSVYGLHTGNATVEVGDLVQEGDVIGMVGKPSMDFSLTGPNLYFQVLKNDLPVNPKDMLK